MKTLLKSTLYSVLILLLFQVSGTRALAGGTDSGKLSFAISIPDSWQSFLQRSDYGNETVFNFITPDDDPVFLFSVTKVTDEQWNQLQATIQNYEIISNENGYITFVQRTPLTNIKGASDQQFRSMSLLL